MKRSFIFMFIPALLVHANLYGVSLKEFKEELAKRRAKGPTVEVEVAQKYLKLNKSQNTAINIHAYRTLSRAYANLGNGHKAIEYADKGLSYGVKDKEQETYFNLIITKSIGLHLTDRLGEAESLISAVIEELTSQNLPRLLAIAQYTLGRILVDQDRHGGAVEVFLKAYDFVKEKDDPVMISSILIELSRSLTSLGDDKNALKYIKMASEMPYLEKNLFSKAIVYYYLAAKYIDIDNLEEAEKALKIVKAASQEINYDFGFAYAYIADARIGIKTNDLTRAQESLSKVEKIAIEHGYDQLNIDLYSMYFDLYFKKKDFKKLDGYVKKIIAHPEIMKIADFVQRIVNYFEEVKDFEKAHFYSKKLMAIKDKKQENLTKQEIQKMRVEFNSELLEKENQYLNVKNKILERDLLLMVVGTCFLTSFCFFLLLVLNRNKIIKKQNNDLIIQKGVIKRKSEDLQSILSNINQGVVTIEPSLEIQRNHSACLWSLLNLSKEDVKFNTADDFLKAITKTEDEANELHKILEGTFSNSGQSYDKDFHLLPKSVDLGTKLLDIEWRTILDPENELQRILVTVNDVTAVRNLERENQREKLNYLQKLQGLADQMTPHFLFNCLNSIDDLVMNDPMEASDAIIKLSDFYRYILASMKAGSTWPLANELCVIELYLELQQIRFGDRLDFSIESDAVENPQAVYFPCLVLQSIVDNSIRYSISINPEKGRVSIRVTPQASGFLLEIVDTGHGDHSVTPEPPAFASSSTGLGATEARLMHLYGEQYLFESNFEKDQSKVKIWFSGDFID